MDFTVERNVFLEGVQRTLSVVGKSNLAILNHLLLTAEEGKIRITATDREIGLVADYPAAVESTGSVVVNARKLYEMVREGAGNSVAVKKRENNRIDVICGAVVYRLPGIDEEQFPAVPLEEGDTFSLDCALMAEMIRKTYTTIGVDELRPYLCGAFLHTLDGRIRMVSTDGSRLSLVEKRTGEELKIKGIILPRRAVAEIRRFVEGREGSVDVGVRERTCFFRDKRNFLRVHLIHAEYPDYERVIPVEEGMKIFLKRDIISGSLKRMNVVSSETFTGVVLNVAGGKLKLNSTNPDVGEADEEMEIDYGGKDFSITYNVRYLIDAIEGVDDEEIVFEIREGSGPGVISGKEDRSYRAIIMPLRE
ncbi:MAG TPA: DNA polymerase III subunit beta [Syntrophales bacterium]|nr:DNA polymerase III subunit beta [Syntrophales bacterium]HQN77598.1 DNA polymerase III subunit beta [Syntrophales bacterium]HQQ26554.1 DNA polymerase III subunit beta [Syntrophales bacterium]